MHKTQSCERGYLVKLLVDPYREEGGFRAKKDGGEWKRTKMGTQTKSFFFFFFYFLWSFLSMQLCLSPSFLEAAMIVPHWSQRPCEGGPPYSHAPRHTVWWAAQGHEGLPWKPRGTHTYREREREADKHKCMHIGEQAYAQSARHVQCTYEHANRQINTEAGGCTHSLAHTHRLARYQKHSKPWTNTNTDLLVLPGTATSYHIKRATVLSEINPVPNRYFHSFVHI